MINYDPDKHLYTNNDGIEYISVTTLIKKRFPFDMKAIAKKVSQMETSVYYEQDPSDIIKLWQQTAVDGNDIHHAVEDYVKEGVLPKDEKLLKSVQQFSKLRFRGKLRSEVLVWNEEYRIAGTMDLLEEGIPNWVYDIKTFKNMNKDRRTKCSIQLELYRMLLKSSHGIDSNLGGVIWFDPDNKLSLVKPIDVDNIVKELLRDRKKELNKIQNVVK